MSTKSKEEIISDLKTFLRSCDITAFNDELYGDIYDIATSSLRQENERLTRRSERIWYTIHLAMNWWTAIMIVLSLTFLAFVIYQIILYHTT